MFVHIKHHSFSRNVQLSYYKQQNHTDYPTKPIKQIKQAGYYWRTSLNRDYNLPVFSLPTAVSKTLNLCDKLHAPT